MSRWRAIRVRARNSPSSFHYRRIHDHKIGMIRTGVVTMDRRPEPLKNPNGDDLKTIMHNAGPIVESCIFCAFQLMVSFGTECHR
jgi:hypothetical protein